MVGLHVAIEFPGVVGDLDVDRWQAVIVPSRVAANVHAHLSGMSGHVHSSMGQRRPPRHWRGVPGGPVCGPTRWRWHFQIAEMTP